MFKQQENVIIPIFISVRVYLKTFSSSSPPPIQSFYITFIRQRQKQIYDKFQ